MAVFRQYNIPKCRLNDKPLPKLVCQGLCPKTPPTGLEAQIARAKHWKESRGKANRTRHTTSRADAQLALLSKALRNRTDESLYRVLWGWFSVTLDFPMYLPILISRLSDAA